MRIFVLMMALELAGLAQTAVKPADMKATPSSAGSVYAVTGSGQVVQVDIDPATLAFDPPGSTGARGVLRVILPAPVAAPILKPGTIKFSLTVGQVALVLSDTPIAGSLLITRNGLVLSETDDYTVSADGKTITLARPVTDATDILRARYLFGNS